jgi:hypothetical protein
VPNLSNEPIQAAGNRLVAAGLAVFSAEIARDSARGYVLSQSPRANDSVPPSTPVHLYRGVKVPALSGMPLDSAFQLIQSAELAAARPTGGARSALRVVSQDPRPDTVVTPGTILELTFPDDDRKRPVWIAWAMAALATIVGGSALLKKINDGRKPPKPFQVRPEPHKDFGDSKIQAADKLVGGTEVSLVARTGADLWTSTTSGPPILTEEQDNG